MIPVELIGRPSWPKRIRLFVRELFGSALVAHLERELIQAKLERDKIITELRAENRELLNRLLAANRITPVITSATDAKTRAPLGPTRWEQLQSKAIEDNARAEAEEAAAANKSAAQEN